MSITSGEIVPKDSSNCIKVTNQSIFEPVELFQHTTRQILGPGIQIPINIRSPAFPIWNNYVPTVAYQLYIVKVITLDH